MTDRIANGLAIPYENRSKLSSSSRLTTTPPPWRAAPLPMVARRRRGRAGRTAAGMRRAGCAGEPRRRVWPWRREPSAAGARPKSSAERRWAGAAGRWAGCAARGRRRVASGASRWLACWSRSPTRVELEEIDVCCRRRRLRGQVVRGRGELVAGRRVLLDDLVRAG